MLNHLITSLSISLSTADDCSRGLARLAAACHTYTIPQSLSSSGQKLEPLSWLFPTCIPPSLGNTCRGQRQHIHDTHYWCQHCMQPIRVASFMLDNCTMTCSWQVLTRLW